MSLATSYSRAAVGLRAPKVTVEVHLAPGIPRFSIVGMPELAVRESRERVRAAIENAGFSFPQQAITAHLGPADLPKQGGRYDLAIAVGILSAAGQLPEESLAGVEMLGELSLSGELRAVNAVLPGALEVAKTGKALIVPSGNAAEAGLAGELTVLSADTLLQVSAHLLGQDLLQTTPASSGVITAADYPDLADVRGQQQAKRALEIAAAGGHNLLMVGPPGSGKSMLASRMPGILPSLTEPEALELASINSLLGAELSLDNFYQRPFRAPHHTASAPALVGGGGVPRPGEISRAHHGVLFLDELPEFSRHVLEVLREPMETGAVTISRANYQTDFPACFQLIAASNPCPCGFHGDPDVLCRCTPAQIARYRARISGPLLDRIDMHLSVQRVSYKQLQSKAPAEASEQVAKRVQRAREKQIQRGTINARLEGAINLPSCALDASGHALMQRVVDQHQFSARTIERILRVARTIADLAGHKKIELSDLAEAISLRCDFQENV